MLLRKICLGYCWKKCLKIHVSDLSVDVEICGANVAGKMFLKNKCCWEKYDEKRHFWPECCWKKLFKKIQFPLELVCCSKTFLKKSTFQAGKIMFKSQGF